MRRLAAAALALLVSGTTSAKATSKSPREQLYATAKTCSSMVYDVVHYVPKLGRVQELTGLQFEETFTSQDGTHTFERIYFIPGPNGKKPTNAYDLRVRCVEREDKSGSYLYEVMSPADRSADYDGRWSFRTLYKEWGADGHIDSEIDMWRWPQELAHVKYASGTELIDNNGRNVTDEVLAFLADLRMRARVSAPDGQTKEKITGEVDGQLGFEKPVQDPPFDTLIGFSDTADPTAEVHHYAVISKMKDESTCEVSGTVSYTVDRAVIDVSKKDTPAEGKVDLVDTTKRFTATYVPYGSGISGDWLPLEYESAVLTGADCTAKNRGAFDYFGDSGDMPREGQITTYKGCGRKPATEREGFALPERPYDGSHRNNPLVGVDDSLLATGSCLVTKIKTYDPLIFGMQRMPDVYLRSPLQVFVMEYVGVKGVSRGSLHMVE